MCFLKSLGDSNAILQRAFGKHCSNSFWSLPGPTGKKPSLSLSFTPLASAILGPEVPGEIFKALKFQSLKIWSKIRKYSNVDEGISPVLVQNF